MATTTTYTVTVAANVKDAITAANVSELALSENAHIARTTLRRRLSGQSPFTVSELQAIAAYLDLDIGQLVNPGRAA
jgi:transcriptional regulator with XRE-family HTH domain